MRAAQQQGGWRSLRRPLPPPHPGYARHALLRGSAAVDPLMAQTERRVWGCFQADGEGRARLHTHARLHNASEALRSVLHGRKNASAIPVTRPS